MSNHNREDNRKGNRHSVESNSNRHLNSNRDQKGRWSDRFKNQETNVKSDKYKENSCKRAKNLRTAYGLSNNNNYAN